MSPSKDWAILDYGCGSGRHVYEYLDRGYSHVQGYDIGDFVVPRQATDVARFRFGAIDGDGHMSPLPWPSDTFDFVFATSVFEHVRDQATAYAEINRVLKPGGVFLNMFPSKWRPLEPHTHIPFGGATQAKWWFYLWTMLGVRRREFGGDMGRLERARVYSDFALTGVRVPERTGDRQADDRDFRLISIRRGRLRATQPRPLTPSARSLRGVPGIAPTVPIGAYADHPCTKIGLTDL